MRKLALDPNLLKRLYIEEGLSLTQTAEKLGCSKRTVNLAMMKFGIPRRTRYEGVKHYFDVYYETLIPQLRSLQFSEEEKKMLALAIDLEGAIMLNKNKNGQLKGCIAITNTNLDILRYIHELAKVGAIGPCRRTIKGNRKTYWTFYVNGFMPMKFLLEKIIDYLIVKKKQAELMVRFCENRIRSPRAAYTTEEIQIHEEIKRLNKRGKSDSEIAEAVKVADAWIRKIGEAVKASRV